MVLNEQRRRTVKSLNPSVNPLRQWRPITLHGIHDTCPTAPSRDGITHRPCSRRRRVPPLGSAVFLDLALAAYSATNAAGRKALRAASGRRERQCNGLSKHPRRAGASLAPRHLRAGLSRLPRPASLPSGSARQAVMLCVSFGPWAPHLQKWSTRWRPEAEKPWSPWRRSEQRAWTDRRTAKQPSPRAQRYPCRPRQRRVGRSEGRSGRSSAQTSTSAVGLTMKSPSRRAVRAHTAALRCRRKTCILTKSSSIQKRYERDRNRYSLEQVPNIHP